MALLLDLPPERLSALAAIWGREADTVALFRAMTSADGLDRVLSGAELAHRRVLGVIARAPTTPLELQTRVALSVETIDAAVNWLAARGLVLALPGRAGGVPRQADSRATDRYLYVPGEIVTVLEELQSASS